MSKKAAKVLQATATAIRCLADTASEKGYSNWYPSIVKEYSELRKCACAVIGAANKKFDPKGIDDIPETWQEDLKNGTPDSKVPVMSRVILGLIAINVYLRGIDRG